MAVQPQTPYIEHVANGVTKSFNLDFDCDNKDHLIVLVDDHEPIFGDWHLDSGAVTFNSSPKNGAIIKVQRNTPFKRDRDYQSYDNSFRPPAVNDDFDRVWWKLQELGLADWLLSKGLDKETQDRILADIEIKADYIERYRVLEDGYIRRDAELKKYINDLIKLVTGDPSFNGIDASMVVSNNGLTLQQAHDNMRTFNLLDYKILGEENDHEMFRRLSAAVNANGGGKIVIPHGDYVVGKQYKSNAATGASYVAETALDISNCKKLVIQSDGARIRWKDGMYFGVFDSNNNPIETTDGYIGVGSARLGFMIAANDCQTVSVNGVLELDGNLHNQILGGRWGDHGGAHSAAHDPHGSWEPAPRGSGDGHPPDGDSGGE